MNEIRIDLIAEPGTPFEFLSKGKHYASVLRIALNPIAEHIIAFGGYVTLKQRIDGNYALQSHCTDRITLEKMDSATREQFLALTQARVRIIAKTQNGKYFLFGKPTCIEYLL